MDCSAKTRVEHLGERPPSGLTCRIHAIVTSKKQAGTELNFSSKINPLLIPGDFPGDLFPVEFSTAEKSRPAEAADLTDKGERTLSEGYSLKRIILDGWLIFGKVEKNPRFFEEKPQRIGMGRLTLIYSAVITL
jgi:hypothetical protein